MKPVALPPDQVQKLETLFESLLTWIRGSGVSFDLPAAGEELLGQGYYDRSEKRIVLGDTTIVERLGVSPVLGRLFMLAHEFGHHLSHESHSERVGRVPDETQAFDVIFEEASAWDHAAQVLSELGMKERTFWNAFAVVEGASLATNAHAAAAHWWLREQIKRFEIKCTCGSNDLVTLMMGEVNAIGCAACGSHTKHCEIAYDVPKTSFDLKRKVLKRFCRVCKRVNRGGSGDWTTNGGRS